MTGSGEAIAAPERDRAARRRLFPCHYFAIDGGGGAHLLTALGGADPRLQPVSSPRHTDLLLVVGPMTERFAPAVVEMASAVPRPARALVVEPPGTSRTAGAALADLGTLLPTARRVVAHSPEQVLAALDEAGPWPELAIAPEGPAGESSTIALPSRQERELATELAVLSLGPAQRFTAGPLRVLLICDGEQVLEARVEAGYAHRDIAGSMARSNWRAAADLAATLDPLAPVAGRLAYVRALERLQGWACPEPVEAAREAALAAERAENALWWLARFAELLAASPLAERARGLAARMAAARRFLWPQSPAVWIAPQQTPPDADAATAAQLRAIADQISALRERVANDRLLRLRTRGIGTIAAGRLREAGVSGPALAASERSLGDVHARLLAHLDAAGRLEAPGSAVSSSEIARWDAPGGHGMATVEGPRGRITLHVMSDGGAGPSSIACERPSAALLSMVPEALAGQKLADAEMILASLDLSMAEADG